MAVQVLLEGSIHIRGVLSRSHFSPSFLSKSLLSALYNFMTLSLFLYPQQTDHSFPLISPLSHESRTRRNGPQPSFGNSILVHAYWYCYHWGTLINSDDSPRPLMQTWEPHHLRTPIVKFAMGHDPRNQEGDPPPSPTEARRSQASNRLPARNRSSDAR